MGTDWYHTNLFGANLTHNPGDGSVRRPDQHDETEAFRVVDDFRAPT